MKVAIYGYGNLGRGVELAINKNDDMELFGVFTRRDPASVRTVFDSTKVFSASSIEDYKEDIDVVIICGGSATDLPIITPNLAKSFNVIDSFDTHHNIPTHFDNTNSASLSGNKISIISVGWDPGMFSLNRLLASSILPNGHTYTFWGKGVSQGHSDAIRRIDGVIDARQYTIPVEESLEKVRNGENPTLTTREKHIRECFVVVSDGADKERIENEIKTMPNYFDEYNTIVHFISQEELDRDHKGIPHGGFVIHSGSTGKDNENKHIIEYNLKLDSNPEFTASVLVCYARAAYKMNQRGEVGCKTVFDVRPADLSSLTAEEIRSTLL